MLHLEQLEATIKHWNQLIEQELEQDHFEAARECALEASLFYERQSEAHEREMFLETAHEIQGRMI